MIERKLLMLQNGHVLQKNEFLEKTPDYLEKLKNLTAKNIKRHGYIGLVATIRIYVRSTNFLKNKYQETKIKIKNIHARKTNIDSEEKREVSKFLKMISEYKHKIREIKHRIKEEEENL